MTDLFAFDKPKGRVAVIGGMMAYFESIMPEGFRDDRRGHVGEVLAQLGDEFVLHELGLWADSGDTASIAARLKASRPDALLFVPTMATPPADIAALAQDAGVPVVIACAHGLSQITDDYDMRALCRHSSNVGATMMGAMLSRLNLPRAPIILAGFMDDPDFHARLRMALRTAILSRQLDGLRVGRLGNPMPGYDHVDLDVQEAQMAGVEIVDIPLETWSARYTAVTDSEIAAFKTGRLPQLLPEATQWSETDNFDKAVRMAIALDRTALEYRLDCGSLTCRGPYGVELPGGAIGCLATSLMTGTGRPFSATGDLVTAVAMLIGKALGGATLYCELDAVDRERDAFLVANTGEADFAWVPRNGSVTLRDAAALSGREVPGVVIAHELAEGPATMLGVVPDIAAGTFRLIALEGETLEPARTSLHVTHGWFRTYRCPAMSAFEDWANAGATHHGALSRGHLAEACRWLGQLTGYATKEITGRTVHD
ncbi:hypothetical protein [Pelagibacterium sp.]|uniref:hypothetical protein n=1 Tax=Pelagibacterium sp. TaxID=1967288 RepID=UPI003BAAF86C